MEEQNTEKKILLCLTGSGALLGIAEYITFLTVRFKHVRVIVSDNAAKMLPVAAITQLCEKVYTDEVSFIDKQKNHIALTRWADITVVLPATANIIGKVANGIADNFMTTTLLSSSKPVLIYPCMNNIMWENPVVQKNVETLTGTQYKVIVGQESESFELASGKMKKNIAIPSLEELQQVILENLQEER
ncbi:lantibiotic biosynthesis protein [Streptococcus mutans]|uniref:flavoprotein n=1 Tax=Streptococcus mutans TaxID=1309 RepID=UPI0002B58B67|nr:flavoprotein [Streptococcus mutans]EMC15126.1 lantibiotic biosynthesis protein, flavoprotein [Streptococcus mutans N66]MCB4942730.1 lantibiotic biosynthesis protein [Streptococcus mutans]MCB5004159.1 lantibiotic biosynthesis protein [Streptococcus mutans]MCB5045299.1 lantibiotic biosynthesis protein [Streptococcus mutans]MCB5084014.1 lantibiotic biosynthesis protein [Streptococcus mutans]